MREPDRGRRHHQLGERVAPDLAQPLGARLADRIIGRRERQLGDEQVLAQRARQVQPLAEGLHAEDHRRLAGSDPLAVAREQLPAWQRGLHQHDLAQRLGQRLLGQPQLSARSEQHQRAMRDLLQVAQQRLHHGRVVGGRVLRVGQVIDQHQPALAREIERALDFQRQRARVAEQADLLEEEVETAQAGQRGRGQHRTTHHRPQMLAQRRARQGRTGMRLQHDVVALGREREPLGRRRSPLGGVLQHQLGRAGDRLEPGRQRAELGIELRQALGLIGLRLDLGAQRLADRTQRIEEFLRLVRELGQRLDQLRVQLSARHAVAPGLVRQPAGTGAPAAKGRRLLAFQGRAMVMHHQARQILHQLAQLSRDTRNLGHLGHRQQTAGAHRLAGQLVDPLEPAQVHAAGELVQRDAGQVMRLVEHQQAVVELGQQARPERGQQQVMVDHDHLRADQALARGVIAALVVGRAMARGAGTALGCDRRPPSRFGRLLELVAITVPASALELALQVLIEGLALDLFLRQAHAAPGTGRTCFLGEQVILGIPGSIAIAPVTAGGPAVELELADIAPTPLGQRKAERLRQAARQRRQVLGDQLLLQRDGGGRDHHARVARQRQRDRRHAVGQRLADPGAGLDHRDRALRLERLDQAILVLGRLAEIGLAEGQRDLLGHQALTLAHPQPAGRHHLIEHLQRRTRHFYLGHGAGVWHENRPGRPYNGHCIDPRGRLVQGNVAERFKAALLKSAEG